VQNYFTTKINIIFNMQKYSYKFLFNSKLIYIFVVVLMVNKFFAPLKKRLSRLNNEFLFIWLVL